MYSEKVGPLRGRRVDPGCQVVVKLKHTRRARGVLRAAASEGRLPARRGALDRWLANDKCRSMEPVFGKAPGRGVEAFRRLALAAEAEPDARLSGLNILLMASRKDAKRACAEIARDGLVELAYIPPEKYVLPARKKRRRRRTGQDPMLNRQWGLSAIELFQAEQAASFRDASDVVIAVIDSGIDENHLDLGASCSRRAPS